MAGRANAGGTTRWRRRVLALAAGLVVAAAAVEGFARLRAEPAWSAEAAERELLALRDSLHPRDWRSGLAGDERKEDSAQVLHPYLGFESIAMQRHAVDLARETRRSDPASVFELGIVGGSVSCILAHLSGARLEEALERDPRLAGREVHIHVLGQGGLKQPQQAIAVQWAFALGWRLDAVVNIDGFNELAIGNQNTDYGAHPLYPYFPIWSNAVQSRASSAEAEELFVAMWHARERTTGLVDRVVASGALKSAAAGGLALDAVRRGASRFVGLQTRYVQALAAADVANVSLFGPDHSEHLLPVLRTVVQGWADSSLSLAAMCERRGVHYVHVLQPTLHDDGSKPLTESERQRGVAIESWVEACRAGYPLLREQGRELAAQGVAFVDASRLFEHVEEPLYYDPCHFEKPGTDLVADAIAEALLARLP